MAEVWAPPTFDAISTSATVTAAYLNQLGNSLRFLGEIAYVETTSDVSVTGTSEVDILDTGSLTYEAGDYWLEFYAVRITAGGAGNCALEWKDGASTWFGRAILLNTSDRRDPVLARRRVTLSAGSHQIKITGQNGSSQTTTVAAGAGNADTTNPPAYLSVTRVIPAP